MYNKEKFPNWYWMEKYVPWECWHKHIEKPIRKKRKITKTKCKYNNKK